MPGRVKNAFGEILWKLHGRNTVDPPSTFNETG